MPKRIDYDGTPELNRKRKLVELPFDLAGSQELDLNLQVDPTRQNAVDNIYREMARTYIKGNVLLKGLSEMYPAQFIPIEDGADTTKAAARRLALDESRNGTVITYSMFQNAVDTILDNNWTIRVEYLNITAPATKVSTSRQTERNRSGNGNILKEFLEENAVAGIILAMFTIAPFQTIIFQGLTTEQSAAKGIQTAQIPIGIALLVELGLKAKQIYDMLKSNSLDVALTEAQVVEIEDSQAKRAEILSGIGMDYSEYIDSMKDNDSKLIIDYFNEYYQRYGGMVDQASNLTLDHWIAYLHTAETQQKLRGALNTGPSFSNTFDDIVPEEEELPPNSFIDNSRKSAVHIDIISSLKELNTYSNTVYDDIVHSFMYQVTDRDLCCLVEIFGAIGDPELFRTIAAILRILATSLAANLTLLLNIITRALLKKLQTAVFELMEQLNIAYEKIISKLLEVFTINIDGAESCGGLLSIGMALIESVNVINEQLKWLLNDLMSALTQYSAVDGGTWAIASDRRHLLGIANVLEVLANRLEIANLCDSTDEQEVKAGITEIKDEAARQILFNVLDEKPASIQLSDEQLFKYFPNQTKRESKSLKYSYGINTTQSSIETDVTSGKCSDSISKEQIANLVSQLKGNITTVFGNGQ